MATNIKVDFSQLAHSIGLQQTALSDTEIQTRLVAVAQEYQGILGTTIRSKVDPTRSTGTLEGVLTEIIPVWKTPLGWAIGVGDYSRVGDPGVLPADAQNTITKFLKWMEDEEAPEILAAEAIVSAEIVAKLEAKKAREAKKWEREVELAKARAERARAKAEREKARAAARPPRRTAWEIARAAETEARAERKAQVAELRRRLGEFRAREKRALLTAGIERYTRRLASINQTIISVKARRERSVAVFGTLTKSLAANYQRQLANLRERRRTTYRNLRIARRTLRELQ